MTITIYHNPACGTSRAALAAIRAAGHEPVIVEYLKTGWTRALLQDLFAAAGLEPGQALRLANSPAAELGLTGENVTQDQILDAMLLHPGLVQRPFVVTPKGAALCRPADLVAGLL